MITMMGWEEFGLLRAVFVVNVLVTLSVTSGEEASQQVMYVTGCLGSNSVILHQVTSLDDVRAVFVYKGGEILGSDIIPAQGDYKGRLQISRQGDVTLSDLRLWDSGVFRIEMTMRDSKKSTYVALVVPEAPVVQDNKLHMYRAVSSNHQEHIRLACGTFSSLGYPAASVLWLDPEGRLLSSTGYNDGQYFLDLPPSSPSGNYSCLLHCSPQPHTCCLAPASPLSQHATVHVHTVPAPTIASQPTPELTSALEQAGENMATGMAALVNEQMQGSFESSRENLQAWKKELEERMEKKFREMNIRLEKLLEDRLEEMEGIVVVDNPRRVEEGAQKVDVVHAQKIFERDVYNKMKSSIRILYQQLDEGKKNMSDFEKKIHSKIISFQRKLKGLRLSMKKHGVYKHERTIKNLINTMDEQFKDVNKKLRVIETEAEPSEELIRNFQLKLNEMNNKLNQGEVSLGSFQRSIIHKMEDLRETVTTLQGRFQRHENKHRVSNKKRNEAESDNSNDSRSVLGRTSRPDVSEKKDYPYREREMYGRGEENGDSAYPSYNHNNASVSETCVAAQRKGGTVSGVYTLRPDVRVDPQSFFCDMDTAGGGWIVIQRRQDGSEDFFKPWEDYVQGFGDPCGEFWLGLEKLHLITTGTRHSLRVDVRTYSEEQAFAFYQHFRVLSSHQKYLMTVSGYSGTAGDGLFVHDSKPFSTWNKDHDDWQDGHCAANYRSAWWYAKCRVCDLNAPYTTESDGIMWLYGDDLWGAGKVSFVEMKIRPEQ